MSLLILSAPDVDQITETFTPSELQSLMALVFYLFSSKSDPEFLQTTFTPHRVSIPTTNHTALFMPARISHASLVGTAVKVVSAPRSLSDTRGIPASTLILDEVTGAVRAIVNSRSLTPLRNAAGSLLSTNLVGPRNPQSMVAFGAGKQVEAHLDLHLRYFPSIRTCTIINRTINPRVAALLRRLESRFPAVSFYSIARTTETHTKSNPQEKIQEQQVKKTLLSTRLIICATSSTVPLFPSSWVRTGTHVILIGSYTPAMREVDRELVWRAATPGTRLLHRRQVGNQGILLVDSREACTSEAGELIDAGVPGDQVVEIGDLVTFGESGELELPEFSSSETSPIPKENSSTAVRDENLRPVTIFKSVGVGLQDVAIACAVVAKAEEMDFQVGTRVGGYD